ncbi:MAG TPA: 2-oxoacid:acceptor oxidoreductase subunit alpha [Syntrophobacteraceae bacterium]|nr:2-oxoacid:acceptor oxidoreductase subunit alpha [Syntrophobacteraceae bacterium]
MDVQAVNVVIGGEAGQGLVTVGQLLAKSLVRSGFEILVSQSYMSRIRGGHNTFTIRCGVGPILAPREGVDLLIALDRETIAIHAQELAPGASTIVDVALFEGVEISCASCLKVPFNDISKPRYHNVVALGAAGALLGLDRTILLVAVESLFGKKHPEVTEENRRALDVAYDWTASQNLTGFRLPVRQPAPQRLMMNGNEAIALGAMAAGVKFCAFYPMTPSTTVALTLAAQARSQGLVVEQAEDEIAAINMAIGASFAGVPSMVTTSGGGFALMVEGVSLAAMTETPVVVVVAQRPGPATGLPTRTEQADLELVLYAGHGEFPRAILTPTDVEECFQLTRQAFLLAERYQGPIFILTDQMLADCYRPVEPFDLDQVLPVRAGIDPNQVATPYQRYAFTQDGISPRLLPGGSPHLVVADSDEHTEDGHLTEDLEVRKRMVEKRWRKLQGMLAEVIAPAYQGEEHPECLLVTWGSSKGAVLEAAAELLKQGKRMATLCFSQVWPLVPDQFLPRLLAAEEAIGVEGNSTGQLARLIRQETGFHIRKQVLRYDGLPVTPEYILRELR